MAKSKEGREGSNHVPGEREDRKVEDFIMIAEFVIVVIAVSLTVGCVFNIIQGIMK